MSLLKDDGTAPGKAKKISINAWPIERLPEGLGLSVKDGFCFGIGFGFAIIFAMPIILALSGLFIAIILAIFGSLGNLWL